MTLEHLLGRSRQEEFVTTALGQTIFYQHCGSEAFASLLSWTALNQILQHSALEYPRIKLVEGTKVRNKDSTIPDKRSSLPRLSSAEVNSAMREGATLIIDRVDELHHPIEELCGALERELQRPIQANLYVSISALPGFNIHWDDHDVIVVQICGSKHWQLYGHTTRWPLPGDTPPSPEEKDLKCEQTVAAGDFLYVPRGWWHRVVPGETPSMHLSLGFRGVFGIELLQRAMRQMRDFEIMRADYPFWGSAEKQAQHLTEIQRAIVDACSTPGFVQGYLKDINATAVPRPVFNLPSAAVCELPNFNKDTIIAPQIRFSSVIEEPDHEASVVLCHAGSRFHFPWNSKLLLDRVLDEPESRVGALHEEFRSRHSENEINLFVYDLIRNGIVSVKADDSASQTKFEVAFYEGD